jgi:glycerophosphoryl diester phosphodiesterase
VVKTAVFLIMTSNSTNTIVRYKSHAKWVRALMMEGKCYDRARGSISSSRTCQMPPFFSRRCACYSFSGECLAMLLIAHRGASGHAPENTLAAFKKAVTLGATFIETDLQLTRDARLVAIHDDTVNRTTNGKGTVHEMTLADLRRLDAGSWFGSEFAGERIPTLDEVLDFAKKYDVVFYLEMKPGGSWGGEHALIGALRESGEVARTIVISFDAAILANVRKIEPTLMTGLLYDGQMERPVDRALEVGARQLAIRGDLVSPGLLTAAREKDLQVVCWTVNHSAHMRLLMDAGVDGIMSDYPDRLAAATAKSAKHKYA